jgi:hypothetical protein
MFSFFLSNRPHTPSELVFGGYETDKFYEPLIWHPIIDNRFYYDVKLDDILYNGTSLGICNNK